MTQKMHRLIETERTFLRPFCIDDIERFAKICANPNVMRYIGNGKPVSRDIIADKISEW
jgi:[ribosomal protein S5]-alanine N-acetyltransferase